MNGFSHTERVNHFRYNGPLSLSLIAEVPSELTQKFFFLVNGFQMANMRRILFVVFSVLVVAHCQQSLDELINSVFNQNTDSNGLPNGPVTDNNGPPPSPSPQPTPVQPTVQEGNVSIPTENLFAADHIMKCFVCLFVQPCEAGECVPYYQCANGTIITDGAGLLDIRFNGPTEEHPCNGLFNTCCLLKSDEKIVTPDTRVNQGCGYRNADGVGFRITGDNDYESAFGGEQTSGDRYFLDSV